MIVDDNNENHYALYILNRANYCTIYRDVLYGNVDIFQNLFMLNSWLICTT